MEIHAHIYMLSSRYDNAIYIGSTINPRARLQNHISNGTMTMGMPDATAVTMDIIDIVPESKRLYWEDHYVNLFRGWGFEVRNKCKVLTRRGPSFQKKRTVKFKKEELVWVNSKKKNGDLKIISDKFNLSYQDVHYAIKQGVMTKEVYKAVMKYYKDAA